jgi:hypothetical protein
MYRTNLTKHATKNYYAPQNWGNFILFKLSNVFDIAIKIYKLKYGAISTFAMATGKQCIEKYLGNNQIAILFTLFKLP